MHRLELEGACAMVAEDPEPVRPRAGMNEMHRAQCPWPVARGRPRRMLAPTDVLLLPLDEMRCAQARSAHTVA